MMPTVDKRALIHSFEYHEFIERDAWGNITYKSPVKVDQARIEFTDVIQTTGKEHKVTANAIVFCYAAHTTPTLDFKKRSKIVVGGRDYELKKVIELTEPYSDALWSVELEILSSDGDNGDEEQ